MAMAYSSFDFDNKLLLSFACTIEVINIVTNKNKSNKYSGSNVYNIYFVLIFLSMFDRKNCLTK